MHFYVFHFFPFFVSQIYNLRTTQGQKTFRHAALDDEEVCLIIASSFTEIIFI